MRLDSAHITNFKLLEDVEIRFSTDPERPLTVIRAENGSGKTSILQALRWAMWGGQGIPPGMPLTSTATPGGEPVTVQVRVDFTERDLHSSIETRYRLIRTCEETRGEGDEYDRTNARERLLRLTDQGDVEVEDGRSALISAMLPYKLADVFFTDGDAVQNFVSGIDKSQKDRQQYVHDAIRQLLGFDDVEAAEKILGTVSENFRKEFRSSGSTELKTAEARRQEVEDKLAAEKDARSSLEERIARVTDGVNEDERELDKIKGIGDLEAIQARIRRLIADIEHLEEEETNVRQQIKDLLRSEGLSKRSMWDKLQAGIDVLAELEDKNVIPGMSVGLLHDRLTLGVCICGVELTAGDVRHTHIVDLIEHQRQTEPHLQRLTELRYESKDITPAVPLGSGSDGAFLERVQALKKQFTECKDRQSQKAGDRRAEEDRRRLIDVERVRTLTERIQSNRFKKSDFERQLGELGREIHELEERLKHHQEEVDKAERQEKVSGAARRRVKIAGDLQTLTTGILDRLKSDHVQRVSDRMNQLFLDIVGADPTADSNLYSRVGIVSGSYDVVVHAQEGRTLDVVTELNGASKRALTFSLIWALMEIAEKEAPRIIDTPLGMTSGAVRRRMVELLTPPAGINGLPYQVVLFMTRSEIRDIEALLQDRAGVITTLSCSKDYPVDLVNDWGTHYPVVRTCGCDHRQVCRLCERREDQGRLRYRDEAVVA